MFQDGSHRRPSAAPSAGLTAIYRVGRPDPKTLGAIARILDPSSHPPPPRSEKRGAAGRYASAATISRALSLSLQSSFRPSLAVRLVRYRNRGVISLGRTSPATFGLRYKAGLLACGRRFRAPPRSPRGSNSLRLLATFQIDLQAQRGNASLVLVTTPCASRTPGFDVGLVPFRSPLLRNSQLVSLTPDSDMLKFSGYPAAPRCYGSGVGR